MGAHITGYLHAAAVATAGSAGPAPPLFICEGRTTTAADASRRVGVLAAALTQRLGMQVRLRGGLLQGGTAYVAGHNPASLPAPACSCAFNAVQPRPSVDLQIALFILSALAPWPGWRPRVPGRPRHRPLPRGAIGSDSRRRHCSAAELAVGRRRGGGRRAAGGRTPAGCRRRLPALCAGRRCGGAARHPGSPAAPGGTLVLPAGRPGGCPGPGPRPRLCRDARARLLGAGPGAAVRPGRHSPHCLHLRWGLLSGMLEAGLAPAWAYSSAPGYAAIPTVCNAASCRRAMWRFSCSCGGRFRLPRAGLA